jgi:hypothetical protein
VGTAYGNELALTTVATLPTLTTTAVSAITSTTATSGGTITNDGGSLVTARGVCWSTSQNPTIADSKTSNETGTGSFVSSITGLTPGMTYYIRAYATNGHGTVYGDEVIFSALPNLPTIATTTVSSVTSNSATSGGIITSDGGGVVTEIGVCWSKNNMPTISDNKTQDGVGAGSFVSFITGLTVGTTYFVRAYATNASGTGYGMAISFTTILKVGDSYQGGKIAYILQSGDPGFNADVQHGLIAATSDQSTGIQWHNGSDKTTGATAKVIGTGNENTITIVSSQGVGSYAAKLCNDLVLNGYSDWYLPSRDELNKLYINQKTIGNFANDSYWSSTEYDSIHAMLQYFNGTGQSGKQVALFKQNTFAVRAIRSF